MRTFTALFVLATCLLSSSETVAQKPAQETVFFTLQVISADSLDEKIWSVMRYAKMDTMKTTPDEKLGGVWIKSTPRTLAHVKKIIKFYDCALIGDEKIKVYSVSDSSRKSLSNSINRTFKNSSSFESETSLSGCIIVKGDKFEHDVFREIRELNNELSNRRKRR